MRSRLHQGTCPDTLLSGPFNWTRSGIPGSITRVFHPLIFSILATLFLQACGAAKLPPSTARVVTDEIGRRVKVVSSPKRFISLAPSATEMLFALGLGQEVVGVTAYCDYPPQATRIEKIGDTQRPSLEKIVALKPDLVVVSTASQLEPFVQKLDEAAIPVYVSNPTNLGTLLDSIVKLGDVTGVPDRGRTLAAELRGRIDAVKTKVRGLPRTRVLLVLGTEPLITVGGNTFINDLIETAGGESISADQKSD
ncbi:MAG TPA: ABC transporter substrate-binding protein, partial [Blastocatellia bacterium]|nr:ABC transporter substrate-binding protein [Blastocatellia bacterium]